MSRAESQQVLDGQFTVEADRLTVSKLAEEVLKETLAMCMRSDGDLGVPPGWFLNFGWFMCQI